MQFSISDKIVYPMHGAGIVKDIEEGTILGETKKYYVLESEHNDMKVMIPVEKSEEIGVRAVVEVEEAKRVMEFLAEPSSKMHDNWNRRYRENIAKLKTGDILSVAEVVRNLTRVDRIKKLSAGEKKLLSTARHILVSELSLALDKSSDEISLTVCELI